MEQSIGLDERMPSGAVGDDVIERAVGAGGCVTARALAVHVEARSVGGADDRDAAILDDARALLDAAVDTLVEAGWDLLVQTGSSMLATRVLPADEAALDGERAAGIEAAGRILDVVLARRREAERVRLLVSVHEDAAVVDRGPAGARVVGGAVLRLADWVPARRAGIPVAATHTGEDRSPQIRPDT
jgi:hypothetical protein